MKLFWDEKAAIKAPRLLGKDKVSMMTNQTDLSEFRGPSSHRRYFKNNLRNIMYNNKMNYLGSDEL